MAQLLFACPIASKDIQTAISFLITRVRDPDEDNWGKINHLIRYVRQNINMSLILRADSLKIIKWLVDVSYAAHLDMKGHMLVTMFFGRGYVTCIAKKHKINVKSSTEAELIGADDALPQMLWT